MGIICRQITAGELRAGRRAWRCVPTLALLAACWIASLVANPHVTRAERPRLRRAHGAQREAEQALPWRELKPEAAAKLRDVVQSPSLFRRMPAESIQCDPDLFVFLVRHPEVVVNIWRRMGITRCELKRKTDFLIQASDGAGTKSRVELVYGTPELHVMYAEGDYSGSLTRKPIHGRCVIILRSSTKQPAPKDTADTQITNVMDVFLKLDHTGAEIVAKALHPLVGRTADLNFQQSMKFVEQIARVAKTNNDSMQRLALQLDAVDPKVRDRFALLTAKLNPTNSVSSDSTLEKTPR